MGPGTVVMISVATCAAISGRYLAITSQMSTSKRGQKRTGHGSHGSQVGSAEYDMSRANISSAFSAAGVVSPLLGAMSDAVAYAGADSSCLVLPLLGGEGTSAFFSALPALLVAGFMTLVAFGWKYQDEIMHKLVSKGAKDPEVLKAAMDQATRDPAVMDAAVQAAMKDPKAMGRLLDAASRNPKIVQALVRAAASNPKAVQMIVSAVTADPKATQAIVDAASKDPKVMKAVVAHAAQGGGLPAVLTQAASALSPLLTPTTSATALRGATEDTVLDDGAFGIFGGIEGISWI